MRHSLIVPLSFAAAAVLAFGCGGPSSDNAPPVGKQDASATTASAQDAYDALPDSVRAAIDSMLAVADQARMRGSKDAKVWMVVMSDFQCPFCRRFHAETYPRIISDYVDRGLVRLAYINYPGISHVHARITAEYAMCAGLQGKFWQYHDALFNTFEGWSRLPAGTRYFDTLAVSVKLDTAKFSACVGSNMMRRLVQADARRSEAAGASATPAFLIGDAMIEGAQSFEVFKRALDAALAAAKSPPPATRSGGGS